MASYNLIEDLETQLASLAPLKAPGASKTKIASITKLCVQNIQAELKIVQSLYEAFKKAAPTHKLGVLYVIDSIVREWVAGARRRGESTTTEGRGEPGTHAAGVKRITELIPGLVTDLLKSMPVEQVPKLRNLFGVWGRGNIFPADMVAELVKQTGEDSTNTNGTTASTASRAPFTAPVPTRPTETPVGWPPQHLYDQGLLTQHGNRPHANGAALNNPGQALPIHATPHQPLPAAPAAPVQDVNSILAALANLPKPAPQPQPAPTIALPSQPAMPPLPPNLAAILAQQNGMASLPPMPQPQAPPLQLSHSAPPPAQPFQLPASFPNFLPQPPPSVPQQWPQAPPPPQQQADPLAPLRNILPAHILNDQNKLVEALRILQDLQRDGVSMDKWGPVLEAFDSQYQAPKQYPAPTQYPAPNARPSYDNYTRARSRSPERISRRRPSPVYGTYDEMSRDDRGGRSRYRQRSPARRSPQSAMNGNPMQPKYIAIDSSLPNDHIKVLSRTLFVGGASGSEQEIRELFDRYGHVQTCIANRDKRHAFVKMTTRAHALEAKEAMERLQASNDREVMSIARQTKWGVGFGPRECCNYQRGESIIPINKLTDADMKWLLTAEFGGTGGAPVEGGMVLEEPDIEIGAGVSSKAMSRRVLPDAAGPAHGGKRQRGGGERHRGDRRGGEGSGGYGGGHNGGGYGSEQLPPPPMPMEAYGYPRPEPVAVATPPAVPGFGFALPGSGQGGQGAFRWG